MYFYLNFPKNELLRGVKFLYWSDRNYKGVNLVIPNGLVLFYAPHFSTKSRGLQDIQGAWCRDCRGQILANRWRGKPSTKSYLVVCSLLKRGINVLTLATFASPLNTFGWLTIAKDLAASPYLSPNRLGAGGRVQYFRRL